MNLVVRKFSTPCDKTHKLIIPAAVALTKHMVHESGGHVGVGFLEGGGGVGSSMYDDVGTSWYACHAMSCHVMSCHPLIVPCTLEKQFMMMWGIL